jgi:HEAT repeat protein
LIMVTSRVAMAQTSEENPPEDRRVAIEDDLFSGESAGRRENLARLLLVGTDDDVTALRDIASDRAWPRGDRQFARSAAEVLQGLIDTTDYSDYPPGIELVWAPTSPEELKVMVLNTIAAEGNKRHVPYLIDVMLDREQPEEVREWIPQLLVQYQDTRALDVFDDMLEDPDELPDLKGYVITGIGRLGDPRGIAILIRVLEAESDGVVYTGHMRGSACTSLGTLDAVSESQRIQQVVASETDPEVVGPCVTTLGRIGDKRSIDTLIEVLEDEEQYSGEIRGAAATALHRLEASSSRAIAALENAVLTDPSENVVGGAITSLGMLNATSARETLRKVVRDQDNQYSSSVSGAAISALVLMEDQGSGTLLMNVLETETASDLVGPAITGLGELRVNEAIPALIEYLSSTSNPDHLRGGAATALLLLKAHEASDAMVELVGNDSKSEQATGAMITALGVIGNPRAVECLVEVARDRNRWSRHRCAAIISIGNLGGSSSVNDLVELLHVRDTRVASTSALTLAAIGDVGPEAIEALSGKIGDRAIDPEMRIACAMALKAIDAAVAENVLLQAFANETDKNTRSTFHQIILVEGEEIQRQIEEYSDILEAVRDDNE